MLEIHRSTKNLFSRIRKIQRKGLFFPFTSKKVGNGAGNNAYFVDNLSHKNLRSCFRFKNERRRLRTPRVTGRKNFGTQVDEKLWKCRPGGENVTLTFAAFFKRKRLFCVVNVDEFFSNTKFQRLAKALE